LLIPRPVNVLGLLVTLDHVGGVLNFTKSSDFKKPELLGPAYVKLLAGCTPSNCENGIVPVRFWDGTRRSLLIPRPVSVLGLPVNPAHDPAAEKVFQSLLDRNPSLLLPAYVKLLAGCTPVNFENGMGSSIFCRGMMRSLLMPSPDRVSGLSARVFHVVPTLKIRR
jgi:hypothetical protein